MDSTRKQPDIRHYADGTASVMRKAVVYTELRFPRISRATRNFLDFPHFRKSEPSPLPFVLLQRFLKLRPHIVAGLSR